MLDLNCFNKYLTLDRCNKGKGHVRIPRHVDQ